MSSRRSKLFLSLRLLFWSNIVLFVVLVSWFFYLRYQRSSLVEVVERQLAFNIRLCSDLSVANDMITNRFFNAASSFASNVLSSSVAALPSSPSLPSSLSDSPKEIDPPPVSFNSYFTVDGVPYIRVRNTSFRQGDLLLGYPIQAISPDVVLYRDRFYKVDEVSR